MIGIRNTSFLTANQTRTNTIAFLSLADLAIPIGRGGVITARYHLAATCVNFGLDGIRLQLLAPAAGVASQVSYRAPVFDPAAGTAGDNAGWTAEFGLSLQAAGTFSAFSTAGTLALVEINAWFQNGVNAGNLDLQFTQVNGSANTVTVLRGSFVDWTILK
jgi:hypothetical protein